MLASFLQSQRNNFELIATRIVNGQAGSIDLQEPAQNLSDSIEQRLGIEFCSEQICNIEQQSLNAYYIFGGCRWAKCLHRFQKITRTDEIVTQVVTFS